MEKDSGYIGRNKKKTKKKKKQDLSRRKEESKGKEGKNSQETEKKTEERCMKFERKRKKVFDLSEKLTVSIYIYI